jgi:putative spermidine/putrescine transport system permease protein
MSTGELAAPRAARASPAAGADVTPLSRGWGWFVLPALGVLAAVFFIPMAYLAGFSFRPHAGAGSVGTGLTLANYLRFVSDPFYLGILADTLVIAAIVVAICLLLAYPVAYVVARSSGRRRGLIVFAVIAPLLIATVIRNLGWFPVLSDSGLVNGILLATGLVQAPVRMLNNTVGVLIALVHTFLPFMILALVAVIQKIGVDLEHAAQNLGAGPWTTFVRVLLPLSRPGLLAGYLVVFTSVISAFTTPAMMGGKRVLVMSTLIEQQMRGVLNYAFGAAAAMVLLIVGAALTLMSLRSEERR